MFRPLFAVAMLISFTGSGQIETVNAFDKLLYVSQNDTLPYRLLKPENTDPANKFPLVIFLHGAGERGNDNQAQIRHIAALFLDQQNRKQYPCYVLAPQCPAGVMWAAHDRQGGRLVMRSEPTETMRLLIGLIEKAERTYAIDRSRIYVTGLSMGGYGTWDLIARFPHRFAAAVPICGGGDPQTAPSISRVPVWAFHGARDRVVMPGNSRTMVRALQESGALPGYTEYPDVGHDSWTNAYREPYLLPWLFQQRLEKDSSSK